MAYDGFDWMVIQWEADGCERCDAPYIEPLPRKLVNSYEELTDPTVRRGTRILQCRKCSHIRTLGRTYRQMANDDDVIEFYRSGASPFDVIDKAVIVVSDIVDVTGINPIKMFPYRIFYTDEYTGEVHAKEHNDA